MAETASDNETIDIPDDEKDDFYSDDDLFQISSWGADLSFRELISRYDEDELVKPELQRNYIWDKAEASRFIDSILLGLPVPSIFLAKTANEKLLIIDGYQRLMTVRDYVKGIFSKDGKTFKLSRSEKVHERWQGKAFNELDEDDQRRIRNTTIHAIMFMQRHPARGDTSLFQVFERINSSGRTLVAQEIRNCVYQGPMNDLLIELNKDRQWRRLYGRTEPDTRMRDMEYILRFFGLSEPDILEGSNVPTRISLKKHLNQYMDSHNKMEFIDTFRSRFQAVISTVHEVFGDNAFHNVSPSLEGRFVEKFSPTIFDSLTIAVDRALRAGHTFPCDDGPEKARIDLLHEEEFQYLIYKETMKVENIRRRIEKMYLAITGRSD